ncbi:MAG: deoxyuridine 5'-triphosphate nucleotidohydrolase [Solobacterium sp.]|nr:deoxyuridine 5'-triphosphate nucleotidohydrolase [Solobacterium sp.]
MNRIAQFEKVSYEQFLEDWKKNFPNQNEEEIRTIYDQIKLPKRATEGSAGYDFFAPCAMEIAPGKQVLIPTGIRVSMDPQYVLMLFPRSSLGFKYRLQMNNTVGIIDSDYYFAKNMGHIFCKLTNDTREDKTVFLEAGEGMVQGIFVPFGITMDDDVQTKRIGGLGSTTKKED